MGFRCNDSNIICRYTINIKEDIVLELQPLFQCFYTDYGVAEI